MSKNVSSMSTKDIKAEIAEIERTTEHWKSSKDGSYEMALVSKGYNVLLAELRKRYKSA